MKKAAALANALRSSGATPIRDEGPLPGGPIESASPARSPQASRRATKPITVHFPEEVRMQLKGLAGQNGRFVDDMVAEALNLLFAKYRLPEIAPRKGR